MVTPNRSCPNTVFQNGYAVRVCSGQEKCTINVRLKNPPLRKLCPLYVVKCETHKSNSPITVVSGRLIFSIANTHT